MDLSVFKAGTLVRQPTGYRSFIPETINETLVWSDPTINMLLEKATLQLGALNSFSRFVADIEMFSETAFSYLNSISTSSINKPMSTNQLIPKV